MRIRSLNHSTYQLQYHVVWGTRWRRKFLKDYVKPIFLENIYGVIEKYPTLYLHTINTDEDHIHLQIEIPPNLSVAAVVRVLKSASSAKLKKQFKFIRGMYLDGSIWSVGYFVSTIGLNEHSIKKYIEYQGTQDLPEEPHFDFS